MFKSSKKTYPSTPKIKNISLPEDSRRSPAPWFSPAPRAFGLTKGIAQHLFPQRSMTPAPERPRRDSLSTPSTSRTRTSSLSSISSQVPTKSILKPPKCEIPLMPTSHYVPMPRKTSFPSPATPTAARHRSSMVSDGRVHAMQPTTRSRQSSLVGHAPGDRAQALPNEGRELKSKPSDELRPLKRNSYSKGHKGSFSAGSDYVLVTETPLKDEAISLSWPLVESGQPKRNRQPPLYFDIAFDPRYDLNVRIYRGGIYTRMTKEEADIPVSSHCTVTKMVIICKELSRWPVTIENRNGLSCMDVFYSIYKTFHEPLSSRERREIDRSYLERCQKHFEQRCKDGPGLPEWNRHQGLVRVDLLRGRRIFKGLKQSGSEWTLMIDSA